MRISYQDALAFFNIEGAHPGGMTVTKKILQNELIGGHSKILDAGCGTGQTSSYLAKTYDCEVYAIDNHPEMMKRAAQRFLKENANVKVFNGTIENLPFQNDSFDYILAESSTAFTHIPSSLAEYIRVLKPRGTLLTIDMTAEQQLSKKEQAEIIHFYDMQKILTEEDWVKAFHTAGFKTVEVLRSHSVFQELDEYIVEEDVDLEPLLFEQSNPIYDEVLQTHQNLLFSYGDKLGYRVFKVKK
ncbi:class I SAM-dependent methyltransferase [Halalkalibacter nanhaiisediminis]|uniref:Methyltransferase family protein n=1 Tax=Halalkalibacter nanhaiisediminis TaxID=688079 RepID=A0A562QGL4_9BACI|nr:class I SAM-dependent methyltransferase [Halalkalibacter nanhaiisediminis]TWI55881.1 methyltransferase family protein [Halalkalibacter nanhaiisediminis]